MNLNRAVVASITLFALSSLCAGAAAADLIVSAAASLTNAFVDIGKEYEKTRPGVKVIFNFAASGQLLQQIARGAPVDVFASADQETLDKAENQNLIVKGTRENFVRNKLVLAVPAGSAKKLKVLGDLGSAEVKRIAISNPDSVPAGRYAKEALMAAGLLDALREKIITTTNVRQSLDYTARGEVDGGFVYVTDAMLMPDRVRVAFEVPLRSQILYPVAAVRGNGNEDLARAFIGYLKSDTAQIILQKYGFGKP